MLQITLQGMSSDKPGTAGRAQDQRHDILVLKSKTLNPALALQGMSSDGPEGALLAARTTDEGDSSAGHARALPSGRASMEDGASSFAALFGGVPARGSHSGQVRALLRLSRAL